MKNTYDIVLWVEKKLNTGIKVAEISAKSGYSERHLYNRFKKQTGMSVAQYIRRRKLTLASMLLRITNRSVTDISLMYCFESLQNFSRAFKKQFGAYPTAYRNSGIWDMGLCQPPLISFTYPINLEMINIDNKCQKISPLFSKRVTLGTDFLLSKKNGQLYYNKTLTDINIKIFNSISGMDNFIICGGIKPGKKHDSDVYYSLVELKDMATDDIRKLVHPGYYARTTFCGTYSEIVQFQSWAVSYLLHKHKCKLVRGHYFTIFNRTENVNIYNIKYHIPCQSPAIPI